MQRFGVHRAWEAAWWRDESIFVGRFWSVYYLFNDCSQPGTGAGDTAGTRVPGLSYPLLVHELGAIGIVPILQRRKLKPREVT